MFTHYEDMKGDAKCRNWGDVGVKGHPRSPAMSPNDFLFDSFSSYSKLFAKSCLQILAYPPAFGNPIA